MISRGSSEPGNDQMSRYRAAAACHRGDGEGSGGAFGVAHGKRGGGGSGLHQCHAHDLGGSRIATDHGIGQILPIEGKDQLSGFGNAYLKQHLIDADIRQGEGIISGTQDAYAVRGAVLRETDIISGSDGVGIVFGHEGIEIGKAENSARFTCGALGASGAGFTCGALRASGACRTCGALRASGAGFTCGALRADGAGFTCGALRASGAGFTCGALRANGAGFTCGALGADGAGGTCQTLRPSGAGRTGRPLRANGAGFPHGALGAEGALRAGRTGFTDSAAGCFGAGARIRCRAIESDTGNGLHGLPGLGEGRLGERRLRAPEAAAVVPCLFSVTAEIGITVHEYPTFIGFCCFDMRRSAPVTGSGGESRPAGEKASGTFPLYAGMG